jgi:hypothetical protein
MNGYYLLAEITPRDYGTDMVDYTLYKTREDVNAFLENHGFHYDRDWTAWVEAWKYGENTIIQVEYLIPQ